MGKQQEFEKRHHRFSHCHGGELRKSQLGRGMRPLSTKNPLHLVLKANRETIRGGFRSRRRFALIHHLLKKYAKYFFVKVEQFSIQNDHIHLIIRAPKRSKYQDFFRVFTGQIAQQFEKHGLLELSMTDTPQTPRNVEIKPKKLWKFRPFTRVVLGYKAYKIVRNYVQLNELEALNLIPYRKQRLRGLSLAEIEKLWA